MKALTSASDEAGDGSLKLWGKISHLWIWCMCSGFSGWDHLWELRLQQLITNMF